jgi:hypothetical protein
MFAQIFGRWSNANEFLAADITEGLKPSIFFQVELLPGRTMAP